MMDDAHRIVVIGTGNVGGFLLRQIAELMESPPSGYPALRVVAVANSQGVAVDPSGFPPVRLSDIGWTEGMARFRRFHGSGPRFILDHTQAMLGAVPLTFVDVTAAEMTDLHLECLRRGHAVVTANKRPVTSSMAVWRELVSYGPRRYRFECTCGAWLPVVGLIQDLVATGDAVESVIAAPSGSLGYILSRCDASEDGSGLTLVAAIRDAVRKGYAEPDPREDLSCADIGRKALILARLAGMDVEPSDVRVESLIPDELRSLSPEEFDGRLTKTAAPLKDLTGRIMAAKSNGKVLRCLATVGPDGVHAGPREVDPDGPFGRLNGTLNTFHLFTRRCSDLPLAVYGPGAGAEVTAAGVLADILKIVH